TSRAAQGARLLRGGLSVDGLRRVGRPCSRRAGRRSACHHVRWAIHAGARLLPRQLRVLARGDDRRRRPRPGNACPLRRPRGKPRGDGVTITVYVPRDPSAVSLGADQVARAIVTEGLRRGAAIRLVRNGSRGLFWLEPMVEVTTAQGRIAYGPVAARDVGSL